MHRVCCCGAGCITDCCTWWACAPTAPINVRIFGSYKVEVACSNGQTLVPVEGSYEITATLVRTGTSCATYRYSSHNAYLTFTRFERTYETSLGTICDAPQAPCSWTHCVDCSCYPGIQFRVLEQHRYDFAGNVDGKNNIMDCTGHEALRVNQAVITIACTSDSCLPGCVQPVLIWSPHGNSEQGSGQYASVRHRVTCGPTQICLGDPICGVDEHIDVPLPHWVWGGASRCPAIDDLTFAAPTVHGTATGCGAFSDQMARGFDHNPFTVDTCAYPINAAPIDAPASPSGCMYQSFYIKLGTACVEGTDGIHTCYKLDVNDPQGFSFLCAPTDVCGQFTQTEVHSWEVV